MFKFVVLCAFVASAVCEPEAKPGYIAPLAAPLAYSSNWLAPSYGYGLNYGAGYYRAPYVAAAPALAYSHFIKKRSAEAAPEPEAKPEAKADPGFLAYPYGAYPYSAYSSYAYPGAAAIATSYSTPYYNAGYYPSYYAGAHFIKKRSAEATPEPEAKADPGLLSPYFGAYPYSAYPYSAYPAAVASTYSSYYPYAAAASYYPYAASPFYPFIKK